MKQNSKEYELFYFLPVTFTPEEVDSTKEKISAIISKYNGSITKEEDLNKKKLSYPIKGARHGYYLLAHFSTMPENLQPISHEIKLLPEVIRYHLVLKENYQMPHTSPATTPGKEPIEAVAAPTEEPKKELETGKVDIQELDRKIDELLLEDI